MSSGERAAPRSYGDFFKPRAPGLWGLSLIGTGIAFVGVILTAGTMAVIGLGPGVVVLIVSGLVVVGLLMPDKQDRTRLMKIGEALGGRRSGRRGENIYRPGVLGRVPHGTFQLPGALGASELSERTDAYDRPFAVLAHPHVEQMTVVIECEPDGLSLADQWQVDQWVAHHGDWLAGLARQPGLLYCTITVETSPDPGTRLSEMLDRNRSPKASAFSEAVIEETKETYASGTATVRAYVALTYTLRAPGDKKYLTVDEKAQEVAGRLGFLTAGLTNTGAGAAWPMSAQRLCEVTHSAYSPHAAATLERARAAGEPVLLDWDNCGPTETYMDTKSGYYYHDGAASRTWEMTEPPRGQFYETILSDVVGPSEYIPVKRVSLLYRVLPPGEAAEVVERDVNNAVFRASVERGRPSRRQELAAQITERTAQAEARGAAVLEIGMLITATVLDPENMSAAVGAIENAAPTAKVSLRVPRASQDSLFATALPLGVWAADYLNVPALIRERS